jgi:hypothetical protein
LHDFLVNKAKMTAETLLLSEFTIAFALVVLMKIVCFVLGYLTIRLGHNLISSGVRGEFKFSGSLMGFKGDLASLSPGLLFVFLAVFLIGIALWVEKKVTQEYVNHVAAGPWPTVKPPLNSSLPTPGPRG